MTALEEYVRAALRAIDARPTDFARRGALSLPVFQRSVRAGRLSVYGCIMFADYAGVPVEDLLRLSGHETVADALARLSPSPIGHPLTAYDHELLRLPAAVRRGLADIARLLREQAS